VSQLAETVSPALIQSIPQLSEASLTDDAADLEEGEDLRGLADLRAALRMVASGTATGVTICGFPDGHELLRLGRELAIEGIEVEPLIRRGGGGFDIRVRRES
jgi:hypothetical protein